MSRKRRRPVLCHLVGLRTCRVASEDGRCTVPAVELAFEALGSELRLIICEDCASLALHKLRQALGELARRN